MQHPILFAQKFTHNSDTYTSACVDRPSKTHTYCTVLYCTTVDQWTLDHITHSIWDCTGNYRGSRAAACQFCYPFKKSRGSWSWSSDVTHAYGTETHKGGRGTDAAVVLLLVCEVLMFGCECSCIFLRGPIWGTLPDLGMILLCGKNICMWSSCWLQCKSWDIRRLDPYNLLPPPAQSNNPFSCKNYVLRCWSWCHTWPKSVVWLN